MNKKDALLQAAGLIVTGQGIQELTLDAVAKQADVSKGGLLYHFPTKEALINAVIEHFIAQFDDMVAAEIKGAENQAGIWLRAYVTICTGTYEEANALSRVLLALSASNPQFSLPVQQAYDRWRHRAQNDGVPFEISRLVCMAADGGWLYSLHNLGTDEEAKTYLLGLREQLHSLVDESLKVSV
jgi:AcrR family transcriptional regulator